MSSFLIIYSTTDGHTVKISQKIQKILEDNNNQTTLVSINETNSMDLKSFDKIIIGASIRYGKHSQEIFKFIQTNATILEEKPSAFFSVNVVARKPGKDTPETNPYLQKFLKTITWKPKHLGVFAGKINYQLYGFWDRLMIRLIMKITKGPTDPSTNIEFTNWDEVEKFGQQMCKI